MVYERKYPSVSGTDPRQKPERDYQDLLHLIVLLTGYPPTQEVNYRYLDLEMGKIQVRMPKTDLSQ